MSLTRCLSLRHHPVRQYMETRFPFTRALQAIACPALRNASTIHPPEKVPWGTIGTALDYRIRYYFKITPSEDLVAYSGARYFCIPYPRPPRSRIHPPSQERIHFLKSHIDAEKLAQGVISTERSTSIVSAERIGMYDNLRDERRDAAAQFFANLDKELRRINPVQRRLSEDDEKILARCCIVLALYEEFARVGRQMRSPLYTKKNTLEELLSVAEEHWIQDMCALSFAFHENFNSLFEKPNAVLNPTFAGSRDVGGADADLIIDGCLMDIKATIHPQLDKLWIYQLLGYTLLDYNDLEGIHRIGILYARQGLLLEWSLEEILPILCGDTIPCDLPLLRQEFREVLQEWRRQREARTQEIRERYQPPL